MKQLSVPEAVVAYFDADKRDGDTVSRCFTRDATVKDEGQNHSGTAAIKVWKNRAAAKYSYTSEPLQAAVRDGQVIVTCRLTGNFPGSPADLSYVFVLEGDKISSLEIVPH